MRYIRAISAIKWAAMAVVFFTVGWPPSSRADKTAIACYHQILVQTHAIMRHCEDPIPADAQQRYLELKAELETFIRQHRPPDRKSGYDLNDFEMRLKSGTMVCGDGTHTDARGFFYILVTRSRVQAFQELLQKPKDPDEGDCL